MQKFHTGSNEQTRSSPRFKIFKKFRSSSRKLRAQINKESKAILIRRSSTRIIKEKVEQKRSKR